MKQRIKHIVRNILAALHLKVSFIDPRVVSERNKHKWLRDMEVKTVLDIGASKGSATALFRDLFPGAKIFAFEPLPDCFALMSQKMGGDAHIRLFNIALSDHKDTTDMNRSSYSGCSSLLPMAELHKGLFPITAGQRTIQVKTDTLDAILQSEAFELPILMKIDVQGFEHRVLAGADETLSGVKVIIIEVSFKELYKGQPLFGDIYKILTQKGFSYMGAWDPDFRSPVDGASLQQDAVFIRE